MMRTVGMLLFIVGLVALLITGFDAYQNTESVKFLGSKFTLSQGDRTPVFISGAVAIFGLLILAFSPKKARR